MSDWILAFGLVLVIEGLIWALFAQQMRELLVRTLERPPAELHVAGTVMLAVGVGIVWLVKG
jgi:hypothetical protein